MAGKAKGEGIVNLERLSNQLNQISEPDKKAAAEAKQRWDSVAKPLGSLGLLEDALIRIAALTGSADIDLSVRRLYLMCADNGVVAQNVTQTGSEVTARMADSFAAGKSSACRMSGRGGRSRNFKLSGKSWSPKLSDRQRDGGYYAKAGDDKGRAVPLYRNGNRACKVRKRG